MTTRQAQAIAAAYACRSGTHDYLNAGRPFPLQDEYGAKLLLRFASLAPFPHDLVSEPEADAVHDNTNIAYRLGLGVLAAAHVKDHEGAIEGVMRETLEVHDLVTTDMEAAATLAVRELMSNPSSPDARHHPRVAAALRMLATEHAKLCDTVQRLQRQFMGLPAPAHLASIAQTMHRSPASPA